MAEKIRRQALSIQENELLSETVRKNTCLYDKSRKEYKDKIVVTNAWKEVADQLEFTNNGWYIFLNSLWYILIFAIRIVGINNEII